MGRARTSPWIAAALVVVLGWVLAQAESLKAEDAKLALAAGPSHIVVVMMENEEFGGMVGSSHAPYFNSLIRDGVLLTNLHAVTHPSEPNYLALTSGSTHGVHTDCGQCTFAGKNIADQIAHHHMTWKAYMQGIPSPCFKGSEAGHFPHLYVAKHDPFIHYLDIRQHAGRCRHIVNLKTLHEDLLKGRLPRYSFISPDECFDMHSCSVRTGDTWLHTWIPRIMAKLGPSGVIIVTFDEGDTNAGCCGKGIHGGRIPTVIVGPGAAQDARITTPASTYSILRLIEDALGFERLGRAAAGATPDIVGWRS
jgi:phosphatidylinositol-3-phosphatase